MHTFNNKTILQQVDYQMHSHAELGLKVPHPTIIFLLQAQRNSVQLFLYRRLQHARVPSSVSHVSSHSSNTDVSSDLPVSLVVPLEAHRMIAQISMLRFLHTQAIVEAYAQTEIFAEELTPLSTQGWYESSLSADPGPRRLAQYLTVKFPSTARGTTFQSAPRGIKDGHVPCDSKKSHHAAPLLSCHL